MKKKTKTKKQQQNNKKNNNKKQQQKNRQTNKQKNNNKNNKQISLGYPLEAPQWGASNEYPQHLFPSSRKRLNNFDPLLNPTFI